MTSQGDLPVTTGFMGQRMTLTLGDSAKVNLVLGVGVAQQFAGDQLSHPCKKTYQELPSGVLHWL
jgi:hypothetical protein